MPHIIQICSAHPQPEQLIQNIDNYWVIEDVFGHSRIFTTKPTILFRFEGDEYEDFIAVSCI